MYLILFAQYYDCKNIQNPKFYTELLNYNVYQQILFTNILTLFNNMDARVNNITTFIYYNIKYINIKARQRQVLTSLAAFKTDKIGLKLQTFINLLVKNFIIL